MSKRGNAAPASAAAQTVDLRLNALSFVEQYIIKQTAKQPPWLRAIVYFMFVMLFSYAFLRIVGGDFAIYGQIFEKREPAKNVDVQIDDKFYATTSQGMYYVVLPPWRYYQLLLEGSAEVTITTPRGRVIKTPTFHRWRQRFDRIRLVEGDYAAVRPSRIPLPHVSSGLIAEAFAAEPPVSQDRLIVESYSTKGSSVDDASHARLKLKISGKEVRLYSEGSVVESVPILPNETVDLGTDYYFPIDTTTRRPQVKIRLFAPTFLWFGHDDEYKFDVPALGQSVIIPSEEGGQMRVRRIGPVDIIVDYYTPWRVAMVDKLRALPVRVIESETHELAEPTGCGLLIGANVPVDTVRAVLDVLHESGAPILIAPTYRGNIHRPRANEIVVLSADSGRKASNNDLTKALSSVDVVTLRQALAW